MVFIFSVLLFHRQSSAVTLYFSQVEVGDVFRVNGSDFVPADAVILSSRYQSVSTCCQTVGTSLFLSHLHLKKWCCWKLRNDEPKKKLNTKSVFFFLNLLRNNHHSFRSLMGNGNFLWKEMNNHVPTNLPTSFTFSINHLDLLQILQFFFPQYIPNCSFSDCYKSLSSDTGAEASLKLLFMWMV